MMSTRDEGALTHRVPILRHPNGSKNMAEDTFHETQHDLARTLIRTFYEALSVQFDRKDHITRDELDRAFNAYRRLLAEDGCPPSRRIAGYCIDKKSVRASTQTPDTRRKDFLTRFVFSLLITPPYHHPWTPASGKYFPQVIIRGRSAAS